MKSREIAYLAVLDSIQGKRFAQETLEDWRKKFQPISKDYHLAQEISYGSIRMMSALDCLASQLNSNKTLNLKTKERALLRTAIYQYFFMDRIPLYALVNETLEIAKKYCHRTFCSFLNAVLRKLETSDLKLPSGDNLQSLSIKYSYPLFFVEQLFKDYGLEETKKILQLGNEAPLIMARNRKKDFEVVLLKTHEEIVNAANSPDYYIQNSTPITLMQELAKTTHHPKTILDLCASPGGKTLLAHDLFPDAKLFANDVSDDKLIRLRENILKYDLDVKISCGNGEDFISNEKFDLIILDVPCSNTGVMNKRPEARWRLSEKSMQDLKKIQIKLLAHAKSILTANGKIWYLTCSILKSENETLTKKVCQEMGMQLGHTKTILPDNIGADGGFASLLEIRKLK